MGFGRVEVSESWVLELRIKLGLGIVVLGIEHGLGRVGDGVTNSWDWGK